MKKKKKTSRNLYVFHLPIYIGTEKMLDIINLVWDLIPMPVPLVRFSVNLIACTLHRHDGMLSQ